MIIIDTIAICHHRNAFSFEVDVENLYPPIPHHTTEIQKTNHVLPILVLNPLRDISRAINKLEIHKIIEEIANKFIFLSAFQKMINF
ncbi:MAG: hypothetical protein A2163_06950 [Actinobacteria bacterium RBG_13_35_12]|nr:MAG: hypothetical protein A2163_06950 [Actinobacteria bacterium RBG_13_35_12]